MGPNAALKTYPDFVFPNRHVDQAPTQRKKLLQEGVPRPGQGSEAERQCSHRSPRNGWSNYDARRPPIMSLLHTGSSHPSAVAHGSGRPAVQASVMGSGSERTSAAWGRGAPIQQSSFDMFIRMRHCTRSSAAVQLLRRLARP